MGKNHTSLLTTEDILRETRFHHPPYLSTNYKFTPCLEEEPTVLRPAAVPLARTAAPVSLTPALVPAATLAAAAEMNASAKPVCAAAMPPWAACAAWVARAPPPLHQRLLLLQMSTC